MINKVILVGRLTKDPDIKSTTSGINVLNFTVAVTRKYKDANGVRQSDFINCVAFRQTAEFIAQYFNKGSTLSVEGSIQTRTWEDSEGKRRYVTEVNVDGAGFIEGAKREDKNEVTEEAPDMPTEFGATDDDLPF